MYLVDKYRNLDDYADHVFDLCHPIGEIYIRYPGQASPQDLYKRGTWENISDEYAGLFFRAEGGNASEFQEVINENNPLASQGDKIREIKGVANWILGGKNADDGRTGVFTGSHKVDHGGGNGTGYGAWTILFNANLGTPSDNPMAGHADGPEIRPVNTTIQIWKRTA